MVVAMTRRRRPAPAVLVLLLAVLALAATVTARPPHAPPLYDGLGFPDEPYRWVVPPSGSSRTPLAATEAVVRVPVGGGVNVAGQALSGEQGPQVAVAVSSGAFAVPAGVSSITLRAVPEAVPAVTPNRGQAVSNLYALTAEAAGKPVHLAPGHTLLVNMRAERATDQAVVICRWTGRQWEQLSTARVGVDIYAAKLTALAPVAVVRLERGVNPTVPALTSRSTSSNPGVPGQGAAAGASTGATRTASGSGPGSTMLWLGLGVIVVALAGGLLLVRRRTVVSTPEGTPDGQATTEPDEDPRSAGRG
jgi:hypothetical protein